MTIILALGKKGKVKVKAIGEKVDTLLLLVAISKALSDKMAKENRMSEKEADKIIVDCVENGIKSINLDV